MIIRAFLLLLGLIGAADAWSQSCPETAIIEGTWTGSPLHQAIQANKVEDSQRLMTPVTINERDSLGNTPLIAALTPTQILEPTGIVSAERHRALIHAEDEARQAIILSLLTHGAAINDKGAGGVTPLIQLASGTYQPDIERKLAERFLAQGAYVNARDDFGSTALIVAARNRKTALVELLLSKGADPTIVNCRGERADITPAQ